MQVSPLVLPYHLHSFQMTHVVPFLQDLCAADKTGATCLMDYYFGWAMQRMETWTMKDKSEKEFTQCWAVEMLNQPRF